MPVKQRYQLKKAHGSVLRNAAWDRLNEHSLSEIMTKKDILSFNEDDSLSYAVAELTKKNVLAAPVTNNKGQFLGYLDTLNFAEVWLALASEEKILEKKINPDEIEGQFQVDWSQIKIKDAIDFGRSGNRAELLCNVPLSFVSDVLATGVHRVAVFGENRAGKAPVSGLVSQSDVAKMLYEAMRDEFSAHLKDARTHPTPLIDMAHKGIESIGFKPTTDVVKVEHNTSVKQAIITLITEGVSTLAVVDESAGGKLIGNFSISDLRSVDPRRFTHFDKSVFDYLVEFSPKSIQVATHKATDSIFYILETLVRRHLHHVFIVDKERKPIGVITLTDIFKLVSQYRQPLPAGYLPQEQLK